MVERILHLDLNDCSDVAFLTKSVSLFHKQEPWYWKDFFMYSVLGLGI